MISCGIRAAIAGRGVMSSLRPEQYVREDLAFRYLALKALAT